MKQNVFVAGYKKQTFQRSNVPITFLNRKPFRSVTCSTAAAHKKYITLTPSRST